MKKIPSSPAEIFDDAKSAQMLISQILKEKENN
jgi:hypothetical protein